MRMAQRKVQFEWLVRVFSSDSRAFSGMCCKLAVQGRAVQQDSMHDIRDHCAEINRRIVAKGLMALREDATLDVPPALHLIDPQLNVLVPLRVWWKCVCLGRQVERMLLTVPCPSFAAIRSLPRQIQFAWRAYRARQ